MQYSIALLIQVKHQLRGFLFQQGKFSGWSLLVQLGDLDQFVMRPHRNFDRHCKCCHDYIFVDIYQYYSDICPFIFKKVVKVNVRTFHSQI